MGDGNSIVNLADITKPVNTLIEKISDAIGVVYEPTRIVRKAKAEAKAQEIMVLAEQNINEIRERALTRFVHEEIKKQENIESIIEAAIPQISPTAKSENIENDWLVKFFENAKLVSDKEMQAMWAKILAGETNNPGTFSQRTINLVSELDKQDAILFTNICKFGFVVGSFAPVIFNSQDSFYHKYNINFTTLTHLDNIGLVQFNNLSGFVRQKIPKKFVIMYYGTPVIIEFPQENDNSLNIGLILLSQTGEQLASICGSTPEEEIKSYTIDYWKKQGLIIT